MGQVLDYLVSVGVTTAVQETLKHTVLSGTCFAMVLLRLPELKHYCLRYNESYPVLVFKVLQLSRTPG